MKRTRFRSTNMFYIKTTFLCILSFALGNPLLSERDLKLNQSEDSKAYHKSWWNFLSCNPEQYALNSVVILENNDLHLIDKNVTIGSEEYRYKDGKMFVCPASVRVRMENVRLSCEAGKLSMDSSKFEILPNGSATAYGYTIPRSVYEMNGSKLSICAVADKVLPSENSLNFSAYTSHIKIGISIAAIIIHLVTFRFLRSLGNSTCRHLSSINVSFLLSYSFVLVGELSGSQGLFCIAAGVLQQFFFLVAFFGMAFRSLDAWRALRLAAKLIFKSEKVQEMEFLWYSLCTWGFPFLITLVSVVFDNTVGIPQEMKPYYGRNDICWFTNYMAKTVFFTIPALVLFLTSGFFFYRCIFLIPKMVSKSRNQLRVKYSFITFLRILIITLAVTTGSIALAYGNDITLFVFSLLNTLEVFLAFWCLSKVHKQIRQSGKLIANENQTNV